MSESENAKVKRLLDKAVELAKEQIGLLENDNRQLTYQSNQDRKKTKMLEESVKFETEERISQERKSELSLVFMMISFTMTFANVAIYYLF